MATIQPPVVPRTERLPLENLGWDAFESFCRDLVSRMPGVRECHHYGKQGDTQLGIDLFADFGPFEDRSRIFHPGWSLVGRAELLQGLRDFATSTAKRVAVFSGRGGIGKSKLLHAFAADALQGQGVPAIRFLADGLSVTPE